MPQLIPFYFLNQVAFTLIILSLIFYIFTKYILPRFCSLFIVRIYINKL